MYVSPSVTRFSYGRFWIYHTCMLKLLARGERAVQDQYFEHFTVAQTPKILGMQFSKKKLIKLKIKSKVKT